jgi:outer membrane protein
MKIMIRTLLVAMVFSLASGAVKAQLKIGYVSSDSLIVLMPLYDTAVNKIDAQRTLLAQEYQFMYSELEKKQNDYLRIQNDPNVPNSIKSLRMEEIQKSEQRMSEFQQSATEDLQKLERELMRPIVEQIKKAIEEVAKEKGYSYVLDNSSGNILYSTPNDDLMPAVKKKLGLK